MHCLACLILARLVARRIRRPPAFRTVSVPSAAVPPIGWEGSGGNDRRRAVLTSTVLVVAILATPRVRWEGLSPDEQAEAHEVLDRLAATNRLTPAATPRVYVPLIDRVVA